MGNWFNCCQQSGFENPEVMIEPQMLEPRREPPPHGAASSGMELKSSGMELKSSGMEADQNDNDNAMRRHNYN